MSPLGAHDDRESQGVFGWCSEALFSPRLGDLWRRLQRTAADVSEQPGGDPLGFWGLGGGGGGGGGYMGEEGADKTRLNNEF